VQFFATFYACIAPAVQMEVENTR